jgi:hypothetical protein
MSDAMFSGWGVRTMARGEAAFNPIGYHVGTVWPHDNSIIAMGLYRYGYRKEAARIAQSMFEASSYFAYRLPEAFAGYPREFTHYPAEYPTAARRRGRRSAALVHPRDDGRGAARGPPRRRRGPTGQGRIPAVAPRRLLGRSEAAADATDMIMSMLGSAAGGALTAVRELFTAMNERVAPALGPEAHVAAIRPR